MTSLTLKRTRDFFLHKKFPVGKKNKSNWWVTPGEILFWVLFVILLLIVVFVISPAFSPPNISNERKFTRGMGYASALTLAFALYPSQRNSPLLYLFGTSFERAIKFHRVFGRFSVIFMTIHLITVLNQSHLVKIAFQNINTMTFGLVAWVCFFTTLTASHPYFRRNFFEKFYYVHFIFFGLGTVSAYVHIIGFTLDTVNHPLSLYAFLLLLSAGILSVIDRVIRRVKTRKNPSTCKSISILPGNCLRIVIEKPNFKFRGGQFIFLNVPILSKIEWHPFSISSGPGILGTDTFSLHIKPNDYSILVDGSFSQKLAHLAESQPHETLTIMCEGPYGRSSVHWQNYPHCLLIGGGIGVAPMISMAQEIVDSIAGLDDSTDNISCKGITLIWIFRKATSLTWFLEWFLSLRDYSEICKIKLYITGESDYDLTTFNFPENITVNRGRPQLDVLFDDVIASQFKSSQMAVFGCGPEPLISDCLLYSAKKSTDSLALHFHSESFLI